MQGFLSVGTPSCGHFRLFSFSVREGLDVLHINVTSINLSIPPPHDQYCVPEYPSEQNKAAAGGVSTEQSRMLTFPSPRRLLDTPSSHARCQRVERWEGDVCTPTCEAQHKWICVCFLVGSDGENNEVGELLCGCQVTG